MDNSGDQGMDAQTSRLETARYIADLTAGMSELARRSGLDVIAYLLDLAKLEAEETIQNPDLSQ